MRHGQRVWRPGSRRRSAGLRRHGLLGPGWHGAHAQPTRTGVPHRSAWRPGGPECGSGPGVWRGGRSSQTLSHGRGIGRRRVPSLHGHLDPLVRRPRCTRRGCARRVEWARAAGESSRRRLPNKGRAAHPARVSPARSLLVRILPAYRTPRPFRRSTVRQHRGASRERRSVCRRARRGVRKAKLRRVEGVTLPTRRCRGPQFSPFRNFSTIHR